VDEMTGRRCVAPLTESLCGRPATAECEIRLSSGETVLVALCREHATEFDPDPAGPGTEKTTMRTTEERVAYEKRHGLISATQDLETKWAVADLDDLLEAMRSRSPRLPLWDNLPTFGGEEPANTQGVWSWDKECLIVGTCADDLSIVDREEWERIG